MHLSTIICPQYLRGVGVCDCLRVCPSSLPFPSSSTVTAVRFIILHIITYSEKRDSHIVTLFIRPNAQTPIYQWQKALLLYYLVVFFGCKPLYINTLGTWFMNPKGSQAFCFHIWRTSWTNLGHVLDTSALDANKQASVLSSALSTLRPRYEPCSLANEPCTPNTVAHVKYALQPQIYALFRPKMPFFVTRPNHQTLTNPFVGASMQKIRHLEQFLWSNPRNF